MRKLFFLITLAVLFAAGRAPSAEAGYDPASVRSGFDTYRTICGDCRALSLLRFSHLGKAGFTEDEIAVLVDEYNEAAAADGERLYPGSFIPLAPASPQGGFRLPSGFRPVAILREHGPDALLTEIMSLEDVSLSQSDAAEVVDFVMWTTDICMYERKRTGLSVLVYLLIFGTIVFLICKRV